jgi:uncharacterized protein
MAMKSQKPAKAKKGPAKALSLSSRSKSKKATASPPARRKKPPLRSKLKHAAKPSAVRPFRRPTRVLPTPAAQRAASLASSDASRPVLPETSPVQPQKPSPHKAPAVPPVLLEGDAPTPPAASGPGERYALSPTPRPAVVQRAETLTDLPEGYGTERLFLTARDPHWLYASWDLTPPQREHYNALSREGHLIMRTWVNDIGGAPHSEIHVQRVSNSWFIPVSFAGSRYSAQLGYYDRQDRWQTIATSGATLTPPESVSVESPIQFATIPPEVSLKKLFEVVQQAAQEDEPLQQAVQQLRVEGGSEWFEIVPAPPSAAAPRSAPTTKAATTRAWTPAQERALSTIVRLDESRRVWMGSLEITEVIRRHLRAEISSAALPGGPVPGAPELEGRPGEAAISSPLGRARQVGAPKRFWLTVNAELVLYGATEPEAKVTTGGRPIRLRPDGTFSYRFALPDGQYPLHLTATSADGEDTRSIQLHFGRSTQLQGEVQAQAQDPKLKPPTASSLD